MIGRGVGVGGRADRGLLARRDIRTKGAKYGPGNSRRKRVSFVPKHPKNTYFVPSSQYINSLAFLQAKQFCTRELQGPFTTGGALNFTNMVRTWN